MSARGASRWAWCLRGVAAAALLAGSACGEDGGPTAGDLLVSYYQGGPEPGAMLLTVTGGPVDDVTGTGGQQVSYANPNTGTITVIVLGTFATGDLLRLRVPDVRLSTSYVVRVEQVADKTTYALIDAGLYTFTVHR